MALTKAYFSDGNVKIPVNFNPGEYTITSGSGKADMAEESVPDSGKKVRPIGSKGSFYRRLSFTLHFDTYMQKGTWGQTEGTAVIREDVRKYTNRILDLAGNPGQQEKKLIKFVWGSLDFNGYIESITQKFTMFADDGRPVRASLDIVMESYDAEMQKPLDGGQQSILSWADDDWMKKIGDLLKSNQGKIRNLLDQ